MTAIDVPDAVHRQLAELAALMKEQTGETVSFGEAIEHLLEDHIAWRCWR